MIIPPLRPYETLGDLTKMIGILSCDIPDKDKIEEWLDKNELTRIPNEMHYCPESKNFPCE